jgi:oligoribonuclease NrnB/cAMP/cGMP phosphodiesterase (DHH superfamily)
MNKKFNYIIFHGGCLDGFSGFFVAHMSGRLTNDVTIYQDQPSSTNVPPNIDGKDIIIIDVAYKREILEIIFKHAKSVVFIDHHVSISDDVQKLYKTYNTKNNIHILYDSDRCGSTLTWSFFYGDDQPLPLFLKYVEDQDTGQWIHEKTKPFIYAIRVYFTLSTDAKNLERWKKILDRKKVAELIKKGEYMKLYNDFIVNVNISKHTLQRFPSKKVYNMNKTIFNKPGQYTVAVYCGHNCPSVTDLGTGALEKMPNIDFCIMWVYNIDSKKYILSMRSREVDISEICKIFGGGGHKLAAACSFYSNNLTLDDLFEGSSLPRTFQK